jgi:PAS domain S-box-containing protein
MPPEHPDAVVNILPEQANVLLVDDTPGNLIALRAILEHPDFNLVDARSGEEALQRLTEQEFAVVLLDVRMPGLSGFETAELIRADDRSRHTPIIFLTADDIDRAQVEAGYALGAVDFLVKPLSPAAVEAKVRGFARLYQEKARAKQEAEQLRSLIQVTTDYAIFMLDPHGRVVTWNTGAERINRYRADEIIGQHFSKFYPQDALDRGWPAHELKVAESDGRFEDEGWRLRKDGSRFWANVIITAIKDDHGRLLGFSKVTRDLTIRREAEDNARRLAEEAAARQAAQQERERLRVTLASIGDAVISTDREGLVEFLNPVAEALVGWTSDEAAGHALEDVFHIVNEQSGEPVENPVAMVLRQGVTVGLANHTVLIARDGHRRPIDDSAAPIRDMSGEIVGVVLIFRDVTEQRRADEELKSSEARKSAILATALDCIITMDQKGKVVEFNPAAERVFGYGRHALLGKELADFIIPPQFREQHRRGLEHYLATNEGPVLGKRLELSGLRSDGTEFPIELTITRISTNGPPLFTAYARDLSESKAAEQHRNLRLAVTSAMSEAQGVDEGASGVLRAVSEHLGWDVGFFWKASHEQLTCRASWHRPGENVAEFEKASCSRTFAKGEGLPGRVWASGRPAWIIEIKDDPNFPRLASAVDHGLHSAFAYPVMVAGRTLGIIEFFTKHIREPDVALLETMGTVSGIVGQFIERRVAEDDLRRSEQELADFFENATVGLHWVGADGTILRANQAELEMLGYRREEYVGRPIADFHADENVICDLLQRLTAGERLVDYPARLRCRDGSLKDVLIDSSGRFKDGRFIHTRCFTRDVTERLRAEAALRRSEEHLAAELEATTRLHALSTRLLNAASLHEALDDVVQEAMLMCRAELGNVQLYNPKNHALEIIAQRGLRDEFLEHFRTVRVDEGSACARALKSGERIIIEDVELDSSYEPHRSIAAAAGYRAVQSTPLKDSKGNVIGMLSTLFAQPHRPTVRELRLLDLYARHAADSIERNASEDALRRSEARFRQLADLLPQIVWTARPDGTVDYLNRRWAEFTGLAETVGNEGWAEILHPDEATRAAERWAASMQKGAPFEMELRLLDRHTHVYRWHLIRTVAIHDDSGQVVRWFGTSTDIHAQKRAEESSRYLAEASAALASVVDHESTLQKVASLAVPHFADWSAVDMVNSDGSLRRLAVAHADPDKIALVHRLMKEYPPDPNSPTGALAVLRTGKPQIVTEISDEMLAKAAKDERHLALLRSLGLRSYLCVPLVAAGNALGVLTFATAESGRTYSDSDLALAADLAQRAGAAIENIQLYQALRETDRRKDEFLATLAHELRNPLAPIRNSLQILSMPRIDAETAQRSREMMERQVHHLVRLVDDLLDVSRVMRGKIDLRREPVELAAVVARVVETVQPLMDAQGHQLSVTLPHDSVALDADPVRLAQVVGNLLANAAKYTDPGGRISLSAERKGDSVELRIRDTGIGIAPNMLPHIFELFVQADHATTKAQGGLGIGLTLVKNLVEMHNGTVEARSEGLGRGSEFIVRLPIAAQPLREGRPAAQASDHGTVPSGHRVLVVDDNRDAANSLAMLLKLQGHDVRVAFNGLAALELTQAYVPDVVFLDIGMPGMDGYEVARRLRQQPGLESVVLAALTGWGQREDRLRTAEAGFDHHLVKPPERKMIESILAGLKS